MALFQEIYLARPALTETEETYIYANTQLNRETGVGSLKLMIKKITKNTTDFYVFEMDLLECPELEMLYITDFQGLNYNYWNWTQLRPYYHWIWTLPLMDEVKRVLERIAMINYGYKVRFYNKGDFNRELQQWKQSRTSLALGLLSSLPTLCAHRIFDDTKPKWTTFRRQQKHKYWYSQTLNNNRQFLQKWSRADAELTDHFVELMPVLNDDQHWETAQMIAL